MAVPTSNISMLGIARELYYGNYSSSGSITGAISFYDLMNSGNSGGSGLSYPVWDNSPCSSNPPYTPATSNFVGFLVSPITLTYAVPGGTANVTTWFLVNEWVSSDNWAKSIGAQGFENITNLNNPTPLSNQRGTYNYQGFVNNFDLEIDGQGRITSSIIN